MTAAYHQLCTMDPSENVVGFWSSSRNEYLYVEYYGLLFGSLVSVHAFLRLSAAIVAIARKLGFCVVSSFYDDFNGFEYLSSTPSGLSFMCFLFNTLGLKIHQPKAGCLKTFQGQCGKILGVLYSFRNYTIKVDIPVSKRAKIVELSRCIRTSILSSGKVKLKELQKLVGCLVFLLAVVKYRLGWHIIRLLFRMLNNQRRSAILSNEQPEVLLVLNNAARLAWEVPPFILDLRPFYSQVATIWTDACGEQRRVGGAIFIDGSRIGFSFVVPYVVPAASLIYFLEVVAVFYAVKNFKHLIDSRRVLFLVDNTSGDAALIKGYSPSCGLVSELVYQIHVDLMRANVLGFFEYLTSAENVVGDGLSRQEKTQKVVSDFNIQMTPDASLFPFAQCPVHVDDAE